MEDSVVGEYKNTGKGGAQLSTLMDRLRARSLHQASWMETVKVLNTSLSAEKRLASLDCLQKNVLLQNFVKATSLLYVVERLDIIAKQASLQFIVDSLRTDVRIGSDAFCVRLLLSTTGDVKDVHIYHGIGVRDLYAAHVTESRSCPELLDVLKVGKFDELKRHLDALVALYNVDGDKKVKKQVYSAIQALEADLMSLNKLSSAVLNVASYIHKTPLGLLTPRVGGLPMKLTYFVGPYDLLNHKTLRPTPMTIEVLNESFTGRAFEDDKAVNLAITIVENNVGYTVTVGIERSSIQRRLQTFPLIKPQDAGLGKSLPLSSLTNSNSYMLPAVFVLSLHPAIAMSSPVVDRLLQINGVESVECGPVRPLAALLVEPRVHSKVKDDDAWSKHSWVVLPGGQVHRYYVSSSTEASASLQKGVLVSKITFVLPTCVPAVVSLMRQQALFNTVLLSCLRPSSLTECENSVVLSFDVTALSVQNLVVTFEHPYYASLVTVEVNMSDISSMKCRMVPSCSELCCPNDYASKVFQRCLSLPVMLRAVLNKTAVESARLPAYQPPIKRSPTPPTTTVAPQRVILTPPSVMSANSISQSLPLSTPSPKLGERGQHNPMLTSLLESDALASSAGSELLDSLRQKRISTADMMAIKRQSSADEVFSGESRRLVGPFHANTTLPISRSYSLPASNSSPCPTVKLEPVGSVSFPNTKPLMSDHGRAHSTPKSSTSELISLLSADDFAGQSGSTANVGADNQFNGSSKSLSGVSASTAGRVSVTSMDWSNSCGVEGSIDWETSSTVTDELHQKLVTSKNSQVMRNSLPASGIKSEPTTVHDGATAGLVAVQNKPPITVKFSRRILKPASQRRPTADSDRAAAKERIKSSSQAQRLNSTTSDLVSSESLDFEVDSLTSAVVCVASSLPGRSSASPRLPGGGTGPPETSKPGEKRQRVIGNKLIGSGTPTEKKRRSDEGRKMSRKIYEFDDDNDVFINTGTQSGKISTIKITKSEGRLQIQKSGAVVSPTSRPVHKSMSSASGQVSGSAVRLGRPPGFPLRPVVRSKSLITNKPESKAAGLPAVRMKSNPAVVSSGGTPLTTSSVTKPLVANSSKSTANSTAAVTKPKTVQTTAKRKGSLSAVIEKLSKGASAGAEPDKKVLYDDIRLAIIREGNKPSTPTREMSSLTKSGISSTKRPDSVKDSSVRLTVPVRKPPISSGSQVTDVGRGPAAMVRFTAPPASPPSVATEQRISHPLHSDAQFVPKIPREQTPTTVSSLLSLRPNVAVSRMSEVEVLEAVGRSGTMMQPAIRMIRPPLQPTKSTLANSGEISARMKTPDAVIGRGVDLTLKQGVETSEELCDRLQPARHFMDAMAHSSRVCDSNVVVDRRLSPPRSPSPQPTTIPSGTLDLSRSTVIDDRSSSEPVTGSGTQEQAADGSIISRQSNTLSTAHFRTPSDISLRSNSTQSPSASGSPVASLIIDCFPGSPVMLTSSNAVSSPIATSMSDTVTSVPSDTDDSSRADMCRWQSMSPVTSVGDTAATDIDDDLMNEALMMSADVSNEQLGKL